MLRRKKYQMQCIGENILYTRYFNEQEIDLIDMQEIIKDAVTLTGGKPFYSVVDLRDIFGNMSFEAQRFIAKHEEINKIKKEEFLLVNNLPVKILVQGYLSLQKPGVKTRAFRKIDALLAELKAKEIAPYAINQVAKFLQNKPKQEKNGVL